MENRVGAKEILQSEPPNSILIYQEKPTNALKKYIKNTH
jgi:hypothetical protein